MSTSSVAFTPSVAPSAWARRGAGLRGHLALVLAASTLVIAWGGLVLTHTTTRPAIPAAGALRAVLANPDLHRMLTRDGWRRVEVTPMDSHYEELGFYRGSRMVASVTVGRSRHGVFLDATDLTREKYAFGSNIANDPRLLGGLALVFVLMTAVWPLWRLRNLDVLVAAGTVSSVFFLNRWTLTQMIFISYPAMIYLALRCGCQALAPPGCRLPATPLFDHLTRRWTAEQRVRLLRLALVALGLVTAMVGVTSLHVLDVGYAVMEGGTDLAHGVLPYGHIPDILHGDTYPIASYLFYVPFAAVWPVHTAWDNADATLYVAVASVVLMAWGAWRWASRSRGSTAGLRAAIAVLAFPPLLVTVSTGTTDVVLALMLAAAWLVWRRPGWAMGALAGAAWFKAAPALLVPLLIASHRGRGLMCAIAALLAVSGVMVGLLVVVGGPGAIGQMLSAMAFQFTRGSPHALWALVGGTPWQQLSEAATLALVAGAVVRLRRDTSLARDPARVAALLGAVLLGVQISASYWNYMYLVWTVPFLVLGLLSGPERQRVEEASR